MQSWLAPAKLNLFLHITGRRSDGYHNLQTLFQLIDFCDELQFNLRSDTEITVTDPITNIATEKHLAYKAARLLQEYTGVKRGVDIFVKKHIPEGGGLGGGSSDAATTLVALNHYWETKLPQTTLMELAVKIGADVAVFVLGHSAWAEGIGEQLAPIELPEAWFLVIKPPCQVITQKIYTDPELTRDTQSIKIHDFLQGRGRNDFEALVKKRYPEVAHALEWLNQYATAKITGSGSCIFAKFSDNAAANQVMRLLPSNYTGFVAKGLNRSPLYIGNDSLDWGVAKR